MRIELQPPFNLLWKQGYLQTHGNGRKYICLFNNRADRSIISNARYLVCVKLGYILSNDFEVDHKDDDKTNDDINNLQILTQEQNLIKQQYKFMLEQIHYGYYCAYCETPFLLTNREVKMKLAQNVELAFCSGSCASKYHHAKRRLI